jgi:hypothetical protein
LRGGHVIANAQQADAQRAVDTGGLEVAAIKRGAVRIVQ